MTACVPRNLTGTYPNPNHDIETEYTFDELWARCMDYFAINGLQVFTADKSGGVIVSSNISFINNYTREVNGRPLNSDAYVAIPTIRGLRRAAVSGNLVMKGDLCVRVRDSRGRRIVIVNINNLECSYYTGSHAMRIPIKSTGVLEQELLEYLSR